MKNLGTQNGWTETPEIVLSCIRKKHQTETTILNKERTLKETSCPVCSYRYTTDSSG